MVVFGLIFKLILNLAFAAQPLVLSQKNVAELILKQSLRTEEINLLSEQERLTLAKAESAFDFSFEASSGYQMSKYEKVNNTQNLQDETYLTNISLKKPFFTGTNLALSFERSSLRSEFPAGATTIYPNTTTDILGLTLEQNLWKNYFGSQQRHELKAARLKFQATQVGRIDSLQSLVLEGIRQFWTTYVAQENFQEALNSRDRYTKLVEVVRKKSGFGYTSPGELSRVQAELEQREQNVKTASVEYLKQLDALLTLINVPTTTETKFENTETIPTPPKLEPMDFEKLRDLQAAKLKLEAAQNLEKSAESSTGADISLVGKMYSQGLDDNADGAWGEAMGGKQPQYYVGLKVAYSFGSGVQAETRLNGLLSRKTEEVKLQRLNLELIDKEAHLQRQIQATYGIALSSKTQKDLREKAVQEINRSYNQGRSDISVLIDSMNAYFSSEIAHSRAIGDYQIALNEWSAFKEELITETEVKQ